MTSALCALATIAGAGRARAQSAEAEAMFSEGDRLMKAGKLDAACDAFDASNRIEPRAGTLIRLGECREQNQQLASAWSAYKDALTRVKDPRKRAFATRKVAALEPRLSYLTVAVSGDSRVDGLAILRNGQPLDPALWNHAVPVNGGDYVLAGRAPGRADWKATVTIPIESGQIVVEVPRLDELAPPPRARPAATAHTTATNPPAANPSATRTTTAPATKNPSATRPAGTAGAAPASSGSSASTASSAPASSRTASAAPAPPKATAGTASARSRTTADSSAPASTPRSTSAAPASSTPASEAPAAATVSPSRRPAAPRAPLTDAPGASPEGDSAGGPTSPWTRGRKIAVGISIAGAATLVVGSVLGVMATDKRDEAHQLCATTSQPCSAADRANQLVQDGKGLALGANVAFGVAGLLVVGAVAQWFHGAPEAPHRVSLVPSVAPDQAGVTVVGRF